MAIGADPALSSLGMRVVHRDPQSLKPYQRNARKHSQKQIAQIAASIQQFGFNNPVLIDAEARIIAGHGRVEAAKQLGLDQVPTIRIEHLSEAEKRAYIIADNRLAELAGWDQEILATELQFLSAFDLDFDLEIIGFETAEIDILIEKRESGSAPDEADEVPTIDDGRPAVVQRGDLWCLGEHRLVCGDARDLACPKVLMEGKQARMVFTDPPYNVPVAGHVCGLGRIKHAEFAMASGEMSETEFIAFLETTLGNLKAHCLDGALVYVCMDWRHVEVLLRVGRKVFDQLKNICVWNKDNAGMGSLYRSKHELVCVFKCGTAPHLNTIDLGRYGRYRTNVWDYPGINTLRPGRLEDLAMHPTVKPVALVADAMKDCTRRRDIVLDAFVGSGTTLIAAEKTGRLAYGLEIDPRYVEVAIQRWERLTGKQAIHAETGLTLSALGEQRDVAPAAQAEASSGGHTAPKEADHDR